MGDSPGPEGGSTTGGSGTQMGLGGVSICGGGSTGGLWGGCGAGGAGGGGGTGGMG